MIGALNKVDLNPESGSVELSNQLGITIVAVSAVTKQGINTLKQEIIASAPKDWTPPSILGDLVQPGDTVVLVVPIDLAAPKGRLILPQVQTIRDLLDNDCITLVVKERELRKAIAGLKDRPKLVVTDSQAFLKVDADTPRDVMMTSFSILFARHKGNLETLTAGALASDKLKPGDRVLIAEACTHHRVADDIGTVKIPRWLRQKVGGELHFDWSSGLELQSNLQQYQLIVHCGGCMINRKEMLFRILQATSAGVPMVNYGVLIAHMHGILRRALAPFPSALRLLDEERAELANKA
jgi:[FeFe] hydrogenase H-cluster maturation GTPase HydF